MGSFVNFAVAFSAFSLTFFMGVHCASVGQRMKRESCGVMMIRTSNCSNHGYCVSDNIGPHCVCYEGWGGHLCQKPNDTPQGSSPLIDDSGNDGNDDNDANDNGDDAPTEAPAPVAETTTQEATEPPVRTQQAMEQTTVDQGREEDDGEEDEDEEEEEMRTERPRTRPQTTPGRDVTETGEGGMSEGDRLAIMCDELYTQTNTCTNRHGYCSVDAVGAYCQCNAGYIGIACQYSAATVADVLEAIVRMMRDPHYRVIGGGQSLFP